MMYKWVSKRAPCSSTLMFRKYSQANVMSAFAIRLEINAFCSKVFRKISLSSKNSQMKSTILLEKRLVNIYSKTFKLTCLILG